MAAEMKTNSEAKVPSWAAELSDLLVSDPPPKGWVASGEIALVLGICNTKVRDVIRAAGRAGVPCGKYRVPGSSGQAAWYADMGELIAHLKRRRAAGEGISP